jgi:ATP-dependent Clp protease adaptor protein ClpS
MSSTTPLKQKKAKTHAATPFYLMVYNDDINTFDYVIKTLVEVCGHELSQATQCTYLIHYKGSCAVKEGAYHELLPIKELLFTKGLCVGLST